MCKVHGELCTLCTFHCEELCLLLPAKTRTCTVQSKTGLQIESTGTNNSRKMELALKDIPGGGGGEVLYRDFSAGENSAQGIFRTCPKKSRGKFRTSQILSALEAKGDP